MALSHLSPRQARQLLSRTGENTHRPVIADTVLRTGALPPGPDRHSGDARRPCEDEPGAFAQPSPDHRSPSGAPPPLAR
jgi:hypothetical protein